MKWRIPVVAFFGIIPSAVAAQPDAYCSQYANAMQAGSFYQLDCASNGQCQVVPANSAVQRGVSKRFLYKTASTPVKNSLVVVQLKYVGITPQSKPSSVSVARQSLDFGCRRRFPWRLRQDEKISSIPDDPDQMERAPRVSYEGYDRYHRSGISTSFAERQVLDDFHVHYFNGDSCVRTTDEGRVEQFLFEGRDKGKQYAPWETVATRSNVGFQAFGAGEVSPMLRYERLHVLLANYKKQPQASGCFSFVVKGLGASVEIAISDIEENVRNKQLDPQWTKTLNVY